MSPDKGKTIRPVGRMLVCLFVFFAVSYWTPEVLPQTAGTGGKKPPVRIGTIGFQVREFDATPSPIKLLEIQVEILNRSQKETVPPDTIKVSVVPKEIKFAPSAPATEFAPHSGEVVLTHPLPPSSGRVVIVGFPLPKEKLQTLSFEVQVNPPEGEKKTATFDF